VTDFDTEGHILSKHNS